MKRLNSAKARLFSSFSLALIFCALSTIALAKEQNFIIPNNYQQEVLSDESNLDIYHGSDWNDMITLNESGKDKGRYLYRTHEVRPRLPNLDYDGGAVSIIDLKTKNASVLYQRKDWEALDGIVWTPWNTLLVTEETQNSKYPDPRLPDGERGHVYEIALNPNDPSKVSGVFLREQLGSLSHEGIEFDEQGNIYVIDEDYEGSIYKFVPRKYGDLSQGQLFALKIVEDKGDRTGKAKWLSLDMNLAIHNAHKAASKVKATTWCRPEDLERIQTTLYVALTCHKKNAQGQRKENRVLSISLGTQPVVKNFVKAGLNAQVEINGKGFAKPDNLANGPKGTLWITEDNSPSDIWIAYPDTNNDGHADKVELFATLTDTKAEATGIYFDSIFINLYVNIQHSANGNDRTVKIYKK